MAMNLPTLIVLLLIAAALFLALWLNRRSGRKLTDCGSGSCRGCDAAQSCPIRSRRPTCRSKENGCSR